MEKERKLQIIRAALKRFIKHGLSKTTLDEVARDLRIGKATLYHYFTSKEDLYYQTLRYEIAQYFIELRKILLAEDIVLKQKLNEYLILKENINSKYKLIYDLLIRIVTEAEFKHEKEIFMEMLNDEENLLKEFINTGINKKEFPAERTASFLSRHSWSLIFDNNYHEEDKTICSREILVELLTQNL